MPPLLLKNQAKLQACGITVCSRSENSLPHIALLYVSSLVSRFPDPSSLSHPLCDQPRREVASILACALAVLVLRATKFPFFKQPYRYFAHDPSCPSLHALIDALT